MAVCDVEVTTVPAPRGHCEDGKVSRPTALAAQRAYAESILFLPLSSPTVVTSLQDRSQRACQEWEREKAQRFGQKELAFQEHSGGGPRVLGASVRADASRPVHARRVRQRTGRRSTDASNT